MHLKFLDYSITPLYPVWPVANQTIIHTINPHSWYVARRDPLFREALQQSDYLIPDGAGIVLAARLLTGERIPRIAGADMHRHWLEEAQRKSLRVFYLGSAGSTLEQIRERVGQEYPAITVGTFSPPYKPEFSAEDNQQMIEAVNLFAPDILFVGMTAPKQEKWVHTYKHQLNARVICAIGAVFDFYAGSVKRPGLYWQKMGLEWLPRLVKEPRRLWRRTFVSMPVFLWAVAIEFVKVNSRNFKGKG